jgi:hypothetical protein
MTGLRSIVGLTVLCALVLSAFAAANASAAGTTTFTCSEAATTKNFSDADCSSTGGTLFGHIAIAEGTATELKATGGTQTLTTHIGGIVVEIECSAVKTTSGSSTNTLVSGVMQNLGTGIQLEYTGCTVLKPVGIGCKVGHDTFNKETGKTENFAGTIITKILKSETVEGTTATTTGVKVFPAGGVGTPFAEVTISGCTTSPPNVTDAKVLGTAVGTPSGANLVFTAASTAGLTFGGQTASLVGTITVTAKGSKDLAFTPLSITTTTP